MNQTSNPAPSQIGRPEVVAEPGAVRAVVHGGRGTVAVPTVVYCWRLRRWGCVEVRVCMFSWGQHW
jgi:hypothetical protein